MRKIVALAISLALVLVGIRVSKGHSPADPM